jgi:hypothetical protein
MAKWNSGKVADLSPNSARIIFAQLRKLLLYVPLKGDKTPTQMNLHETTDNETIIHHAITPSVLACLSKSRALWINWVQHFAQPQLFAIYVARACHSDLRLSSRLIKYLVANLDEKGLQKNFKVPAFQKRPVQLYGEDALAAIMAIDDSQEYVAARVNYLLGTVSPDGNQFLDRIRGWQVNTQRTEADRRVNALEVLRLMRFFLRLFCHVPPVRAHIKSSKIILHALAEIVFYLEDIDKELSASSAVHSSIWQREMQQFQTRIIEHEMRWRHIEPLMTVQYNGTIGHMTWCERIGDCGNVKRTIAEWQRVLISLKVTRETVEAERIRRQEAHRSAANTVHMQASDSDFESDAP